MLDSNASGAPLGLGFGLGYVVSMLGDGRKRYNDNRGCASIIVEHSISQTGFPKAGGNITLNSHLSHSLRLEHRKTRQWKQLSVQPSTTQCYEMHMNITCKCIVYSERAP